MRNAKFGIGAQGMSASSLAVLLRCFVIGLCSALRFCRDVLHSALLGITVLLRRFAIGLRSALWFCYGVLPSVHAWPCGSVAALCLRFTPVFFTL